MLARWLVALASVLVMPTAMGQDTPIAGIDYRDLGTSPSRVSRGGIEVVEYFWYRCPHCYALEPLLNAWIARLPAGVHFRRIPAVLGKEWLIDARIFYALQEIGELERLHQPLLYAINEKGGRRYNRSAYEEWVADWLHAQGVDMTRYSAALASREVQRKADESAQLSRQLQLEGTPTFEVAGRYLISPPLGDRYRTLQVTDYVVDIAMRSLPQPLTKR